MKNALKSYEDDTVKGFFKWKNEWYFKWYIKMMKQYPISLLTAVVKWTKLKFCSWNKGSKDL